MEPPGRAGLAMVMAFGSWSLKSLVEAEQGFSLHPPDNNINKAKLNMILEAAKILLEFILAGSG